MHALTWIDIAPGDPRREQELWEQFPGRCDRAYALELELKRRYEELLADVEDDAAILFLATSSEGNRELRELARQRLGERSIETSLPGEWDKMKQGLGARWETFLADLRGDQALATERRGVPTHELPPGRSAEPEFSAWVRSRAWACDLAGQLEERDLSFDPESTPFVAFGEDWSYCAATYPIQMGRAFALAHPIERRFDLMNPDESPMLLSASVVEQNIPMPEQIRLFIFRTSGDRYVAQFYEGLHGIMDPPHVVVVDFPRNSVERVDLWGEALERRIGSRCVRNHGTASRMMMSVGCGGHTAYEATLVMAQRGLPLETFQASLVSGRVISVV